MPDGVLHKQVIDGVRELMNYDPQSDTMIARWDTKINDKQFHVIDYKTSGIEESVGDWLEKTRAIALAKLRAIDEKSTPV